MTHLFDIVIPLGPNDETIIAEQLKYTKKNVIGYRNIYIITCCNVSFDECIIIDDGLFPFGIGTVEKFHGKLKRNGWYLQQLLKLYAGLVIPDILEKYLVIDSDTFFLKPTTFVKDDKCMYNYGDEFHHPYFDHISKLDSQIVKVNNMSGICHHMMFETKYVREIINNIEDIHNDKFYNVFFKQVDKKCRIRSGSSEYELYFNYMMKYHSDKIEIRKLRWDNMSVLDTNNDNDYISCHWYIRK